MRETTSSEFVAWRSYFETEDRSTKQEHFYLAQIAAEIRRTIVKNPKSISIDQFLLKFQRRKQHDRKFIAEEKRKIAERNKSIWIGFINASYARQMKRRPNV